jgi:tubulin polyglutamylase TTLL1
MLPSSDRKVKPVKIVFDSAARKTHIQTARLHSFYRECITVVPEAQFEPRLRVDLKRQLKRKENCGSEDRNIALTPFQSEAETEVAQLEGSLFVKRINPSSIDHRILAALQEQVRKKHPRSTAHRALPTNLLNKPYADSPTRTQERFKTERLSQTFVQKKKSKLAFD